jgi:chromosome segregation ATPase
MSNKPTIPPTVADAEAAIASLQQKRDALVAHGSELATMRASTAFKALHEHDATAQATLDRINKESIEHDHALASIDAALKTAQQRLEAAKRHEAKQADRAAAVELRGQLAQFVAAGKALDGVLEVLVSASHDMRNALTAMNRLGCTHPSHAQLDSLGALALRTALTETAWVRYFERVSPVERKTFAGLVAAWSQQVERSVKQRLDDQTNETEAA